MLVHIGKLPLMARYYAERRQAGVVEVLVESAEFLPSNPL